MPVKAIIISIAVLMAAGAALYDNREQVQELLDKARRKLASKLHTLAEDISPDRQKQQSHEAIPMDGRPFGGDSQHLSEKAGEASGYALQDQSTTLRQRGAGGSRDETAAGGPALLFETGSDHDETEKLMAASSVSSQSLRSSTATLGFEKPLPPPPPPAAVAAVAAPPAESPFESGYESLEQAPARTAPSSHTFSDAEGSAGTPLQNPFENSQPYWSIHEWAENTSHEQSSSPSLAGSAAEDIDAVSDLASEFGSVPESVNSWEEVRSDISGDR